MNFKDVVKEKLSVGTKIKNYKVMCSILNQEEKKGKSRTLQMLDWERYFKWHKEGQKFIIDEVFEVPIEKVNNRGKSKGSRNNNQAEYINNIEKLILNLLAQGSCLGYGKVLLSKSKMLKELKMINDNYTFCKLRIPKLSEFTNIDKETIQDWFDSTWRMLETNLDTALKKLNSQSLVFWSKEITVAKAIPIAELTENKISKHKIINEYNEETINYEYYTSKDVMLQFREGTDKEKRFILYTEKEVLKEMNFDNKSQVVTCGKWQDFIERVNDILLDKLNIAFYYKSYKILFNKEHILEKAIEINDFKLSEIDEITEKSFLNKSVVQRIENNAINRHERAKKEKDNILSSRTKSKVVDFRSKDSYIDSTKELNNKLIDYNMRDITNHVRKIKFK